MRDKFYNVSTINPIATARSAAPALVLLHAFPVGARMWEPQRGAFPGWRVVAPSLPGFDGSPRATAPSMAAYAESVLAVLNELAIDRAVVGGISMGGYVAFALARQARGRVAGIIAADTRSSADSDEGKAGRRRMLELIEARGAAGVADDMIPKLLGATTRGARPDIATHVSELIEAQAPLALADATRAMMTREDSTPLLESIDVPALIVVGEEDTLTPPVEAERLAAAFPRASLVRIPTAGHLSSLENPETFNAAVRVFLREIVVENTKVV